MSDHDQKFYDFVFNAGREAQMIEDYERLVGEYLRLVEEAAQTSEEEENYDSRNIK